MTRKILKAVYFAFYTLAIIIIAVLVLSILPGKNLPKTLTVLSGSMEPTIHTGSVVVVKPAGPGVSYKVGDIITFGPNTKTQIPTTHRIIEIRAQEGQIIYRTKGDANNSADVKEVSEANIIGKVYLSVPYAGYAVNFVRKPAGLILVIVLPAVLIIYDETRKIMKELNRIKRQKVPNQNFSNNEDKL